MVTLGPEGGTVSEFAMEMDRPRGPSQHAVPRRPDRAEAVRSPTFAAMTPEAVRRGGTPDVVAPANTRIRKGAVGPIGFQSVAAASAPADRLRRSATSTGSVNRTGLPSRLKAGVETLSNVPLDHVRVHRNSSLPGQIGATAFTDGTRIHLAPGREQDLPHEAWHVVQQCQGRVAANRVLGHGIAGNADADLEREADVMGARAAGAGSSATSPLDASLERDDLAVSRRPAVVQRSTIVKHEYQHLENPVHTVAKQLAWATGLLESRVVKDMEKKFGKLPKYATMDRPDRVIAYLTEKPESDDRVDIITRIGHLGNLEEALRGRSRTDFNGGHLIALSLFKEWKKINTPSNLAPQRANDNKAPGMWRQAEMKLRAGTGVVYETSVSYPDRTYWLTVGGMKSAVEDGSDTADALAQASAATRLFPWSVHTWTPSQFTVVVTPLSDDAATAHDTETSDPTSWLPIVSRFASPLKGQVARLLPFGDIVQHVPSGIFRGGVDVRTRQNHPAEDSLDEIKQIIIDITKLTSLMYWVLPMLGVDVHDVFEILEVLPGMPMVIDLLRPIAQDDFLAALIVYCVFHQANASRSLPEVPGLDWLKYAMQLIGL